MLERLNLAPVRFRRACAPNGPIARVEWTTVGLYGVTICQANAWLRPGLRPTRRRGIYSDADGTGSAPTPSVARHKAISEALERWAYDCAFNGPERVRFGFDLDPTSSGMAAFPGLVTGAARKAALAEAIERSCLIAWSTGLVSSRFASTEWPGVHAVEIDSPAGGSCVILYRRSPAGCYVYGHAAADSFTGACERALVELGRNERVMARRCASGEAVAPANLFERRCLYYSTEEGHARFLGRVGATPPALRWRPRIVIDTEIPGPWSAYATVWRVLFQPPVENFLTDELDFFLW